MVTSVLYMFVVGMIGAWFVKPGSYASAISIGWSVVFGVLIAAVFFSVVVVNFSRNPQAPRPRKPANPNSSKILSPRNLKFTALGLFAFAMGIAFPTIFGAEPVSPPRYWHLAYGVGALIGWAAGTWLLASGERKG